MWHAIRCIKGSPQPLIVSFSKKSDAEAFAARIKGLVIQTKTNRATPVTKATEKLFKGGREELLYAGKPMRIKAAAALVKKSNENNLQGTVKTFMVLG